LVCGTFFYTLLGPQGAGDRLTKEKDTQRWHDKRGKEKEEERQRGREANRRRGQTTEDEAKKRRTT